MYGVMAAFDELYAGSRRKHLVDQKSHDAIRRTRLHCTIRCCAHHRLGRQSLCSRRATTRGGIPWQYPGAGLQEFPAREGGTLDPAGEVCDDSDELLPKVPGGTSPSGAAGLRSAVGGSSRRMRSAVSAPASLLIALIDVVVIVLSHMATLAALWLRLSMHLRAELLRRETLLMLTNHHPAIGRDREQLGVDSNLAVDPRLTAVPPDRSNALPAFCRLVIRPDQAELVTVGTGCPASRASSPHRTPRSPDRATGLRAGADHGARCGEISGGHRGLEPVGAE
jgi:hypothetical protein